MQYKISYIGDLLVLVIEDNLFFYINKPPAICRGDIYKGAIFLRIGEPNTKKKPKDKKPKVVSLPEP